MKATFGTAGMLLCAWVAAYAQVVINEFQANPSERILKWDANGVPTLGSGKAWYEPSFDDSGWSGGNQPFGQSVSGLGTDLSVELQGKAHALYLRKEFNVGTIQASSTDLLQLTIRYDDGFIAYLNGVEVARKNLGPERHFIHAGQRAYNASVIGVSEVIDIGSCNQFLVDGTNLLAIQVQNFTEGGDLIVNASLRSAGAPQSMVVAEMDFNNGTGASQTVTIVDGGAPTTSTSGTAQSWLTQVDDPAVAGTWDSLEIVTTEVADGGIGGSGHLSYDITQLGGSGGSLWLSGPEIDMSSGWLTGDVTQQMLEDTWVTFRYRVTPGTLFSLDLLPGGGQEDSALTGAPWIGAATAPEHPQFTFNGPGGSITYTTDGAGVDGISDAGDRWYYYSLFASENLANGEWVLTEDPATASPAGGAPGVLRYEVTQLPTEIDPQGSDWFGMLLQQVRMEFWPRGRVTTSDLMRTRIRFRHRMTAGNECVMQLEPDDGGFNERLELGYLKGTGEWEMYDGRLGSWANAPNWLNHINAGSSDPLDRDYGGYLGGKFVLVFDGIDGISVGDSVEIDDIEIWYDTALPEEQVTLRDFTDNNGGREICTIDSVGTETTIETGELVNSYRFFTSGDLRNGQMELVENAQLPSPDASTGYGVLNFNWLDPAEVTLGGDDSWWWWMREFESPGWPALAVTDEVLARSNFRFKMKGPVGKPLAVSIELEGLGEAERLVFGNITGTGNWESYDLPCGSAGNTSAFIAGINGDAARVNDLRIIFGSADMITNYQAGDSWWIDDLELNYIEREAVATKEVKSFHGIPGTGITYTIDSAGGTSSSGGVSAVDAVFSSSASLRDGVFSLSENTSEAGGSGDGNGPGFLRLEVTSVPTTVVPGDHWWEMVASPFAVPEWPAGQVTHYDLERTRLVFRVRMPSGRSLGLKIDADGSGGGSSCDMGVLTGDGTWQTYERTLGQGGNLDAFLAAVNANVPVNTLKLIICSAGPPGAYSDGDAFDFDNIEFVYEGYSTGDAGFLTFEDALGAVRVHERVDAVTQRSSHLGDFTAGSNVVINMTSVAGIEVGMMPVVLNIPAGTTVTAIDAGAGTLTLSANATATGSQVAMTFGVMRHHAFTYSDSAAAGFVVTVTEDDTPGAGYRASDGHLRVDYHHSAAAGAYVGVAIDDVNLHNLDAGMVTAGDLDATTLEFVAKVPAGIQWTCWLEPNGGGYTERLDLDPVIGSGDWQEVSLPLIDRNNTRTGFINQLNLDGSNRCRLVFNASPQHAPGTVLQLDDVVVSSWREYRVSLASLGGASAFLDSLNGNALASLMPVFNMQSSTGIGGSSLDIDDFSIDYLGPAPASLVTHLADGGAAGPWNYFAGIHEPSGIVVDTMLVTTPFPAPVGKEGDYEDPEDARDWVELRNTGGSPYDLTGHSLTDDDGNPGKWTFPAGTTIPANGYLLVFCDNRFEANGPTADFLHTNFGLSSEGGVVSLYLGGGLVDTAAYPGGQSPHYSYGRSPVDNTWVYFDDATPLAMNEGGEFPDKCDKPNTYALDGVTPVNGGFYDSALTVVLISNTPGAAVRYTLDGSEPVPTSTLYTGPLSIIPVDDKTGTVLRARAFLAGYLPSKVMTQTFLVGQNAAIKTLPAMVMTGDEQRVWYDDMGVMSIRGGAYDAEGFWYPDGPDSYNIPMLSGSPSERPAYVEYMHPDGITAGFGLNAGVRLSASNWTTPRLRFENPYDSPWNPWAFEEKASFNLFFRGIYGNSKLNYPLLPGYDVVRFDQLRLRAGKNDIDNPHIVDELCRRIFMAMGHEGATGTWCTLYVNGVFKGYYNLCERVREPFFKEHFGSSQDWDVIYNGQVESGTSEAFDTLIHTDLNRSMSVLANYDIVRSKLDIENVCDYYLMKIYTAMWDWPNNNWVLARERSDGPNGVFRFADWDSEGGFNVVGIKAAEYGLTGYGKPVDYDTLGNDLDNSHTEVGHIFDELRKSPEFRLAMADRIQKHFFNGGVLDDRASVNPDFWLKQTKDELKALVEPIMQHVIGESFDEGWFTIWTDELTGRRSHLFGGGPASFEAHGFWPSTTAADFSLASGNVSYGTTVELTAASGTIYYTMDGSDPRLDGGAVNPDALVYSGPISLVVSGTIKARVLDGGVWSPLAEGDYLIDPVDPAVGNLAIVELMYHGAPPTATEAALGYDTDSFDYCRVMNTGSNPVVTAGLSFFGITCILPNSGGNVPYIEPGESFLVVRDANAFRYRYGSGYDHMIAADYSSNFSNGGELVKLIHTPPGGGVAVDIFAFTYSDDPPWPLAPDRYGPSLLMIDPPSHPDPNLASSWVASCGVGGQPGGVPLDTGWDYWSGLAFPAGDPAADKLPDADPDGDGIVNSIEYALGTSPQLSDHRSSLPEWVMVEDGGAYFPGLECRVNTGAIDANITVETSSTLAPGSWQAGPGHTVDFGEPAYWVDGSHTFIVRDAVPMGDPVEPRRFIRMNVPLE